MAVLDDSIFGQTPEGQRITYGEVRAIIDNQRKLEVLKSRLDIYLIRQVNELSVLTNDHQRKVYSPFPLMILTLLSIETLGHVIGDVEKIKKENEYEHSKAIVTPVYFLLNKSLSHKPSKQFYKAFESLHKRKDRKALKKYSDVIHIYQRNTFNHGYQSRGVYLTEDINKEVEIDEEKGCLYINPYLFWEQFKTTYEKVFDQIHKDTNSEWRNNALSYFERLIK